MRAGRLTFGGWGTRSGAPLHKAAWLASHPYAAQDLPRPTWSSQKPLSATSPPKKLMPLLEVNPTQSQVMSTAHIVDTTILQQIVKMAPRATFNFQSRVVH